MTKNEVSLAREIIAILEGKRRKHNDNRRVYSCGEYSNHACIVDLRICGMLNKEYNGRPIIELRKHGSKEPEPEPELDGQMTFETGEIE